MPVVKRPSPGPRWFLLVVLLCCPLKGLSDEPIPKEYAVKAVFLFNFAQFVDWPQGAFTDPTEPFKIGILGEDPFRTYLDATVQGEKIDGHPLEVERYHRGEPVGDCQILFICQSETAKMADILSGLKGHSILTVGDTPQFIRQGGMIDLQTERHKVRLRINLKAAQDAGLSISSKMLRLAEVVDPGEAAP